MALGDPFATTFAGAYKGVSAFGEALTGIAEAYTGAKEKQAEEEAKLKLEKEKAKIKAETPSFLETLIMTMPQFAHLFPKKGAEGEITPPITAPTAQPTTQPSVLGAPLAGGVDLGGALRQPQIDIPLSAGLKYDPLQMKTEEAKIGLAKKEAEVPLEVEVAAQKEEEKEVTKRYGQAARVVGAFRNIQSQFKRADKDFGRGRPEGGTGGRAALTYDLSRWRYAPYFMKKAAEPLAAAEAQAKEVTIALLPILSGQARYVQSLAENIAKTVPDVSVIKISRDDLTAQSIKNNMTLVYGIQNGFLGAENLRRLGVDPDSEVTSAEQAQALLSAVQLTPEQEEAIEDAIKYTLAAPTAKSAREYKEINNEKDLNRLGLDPAKYEIVR